MRIRLAAPLAVAALAGVLLLPSPPKAAAVDFDRARTGESSGQATSAPPGSQRLEMDDARRIARKVARGFAQSDDRVTTAAVGDCKRRSEQRIDCLAVDQGASSTTKTVCRLRVSIRTKNGSPSAKLTSSQCQATSLLTLTEAEALAAMTATLSEVTGKSVLIPAISRRSQDSFSGIGEWTRTGATGSAQKCTAILTATRRSLTSVTVSIDLPECRGGTQPPKGGGGPIYF